jgi:RNA polymerase sigma factor (sigma-70 family)
MTPDEAIARTYLAHHPELLRFLRRRLGREDEAADLAQESFLRWLDCAYQKNGGVRTPRAFLFRVAQNLPRDYWRRQARHEEAVQDGPGVAHAMHRASCSPEHAVEQTQRLTQLAQAIQELPPRCREALMLHKFAGLPQAEVALRMGISRNMVEKHLINAMLLLRSRVTPSTPS